MNLSANSEIKDQYQYREKERRSLDPSCFSTKGREVMLSLCSREEKKEVRKKAALALRLGLEGRSQLERIFLTYWLNIAYKIYSTTSRSFRFPETIGNPTVFSKLPVTIATMKDEDVVEEFFRREPPAAATLDFRTIRAISAVGRGAKGVVFLARDDACDDGNEIFALKVISRALLQKKAKAVNNGLGQCKRVSFEQQVLRQFDHPLLPRLRGVLETEKIIAHAIPYCSGGNLHSLRKRQSEKMFSNDSIRFYAVELILALEYLHGLGIVYRDLKPENIMIQDNGHIMLVDFDLSKKLNSKSPPTSCHSSPSSDSVRARRKSCILRFYSFCSSGITPYDSDFNCDNSTPTDSCSVEKSNSFVGTEEYVSPDVISGKGHDFGVDWWSLGVVLYEMLYGTTPFKGANRKETFYRILTKDPELAGEKTPLRDLIGKLLEKDPNRRIGLDEIKSHEFFEGVNWDMVLEISRPPFIPETEVRDRDGISKIDVELFVHGIFFGKSVEDEKKNKVQEGKKGEENLENNKGVWVEKLSQQAQHPTEAENFLIF
ncbi:hypothetical protein L6164_000353 [Bauhinia variegata]|uniref:Uncharacterized protein n=1 Tax=Bauhinia variegata TaxID=167791 RepID=A0ACB9Q5N6_BAUVA|nr:hypothetical protein L6164_000353 [Bauhinia variegata]